LKTDIKVGVIEGFFGKPWDSSAGRAELISCGTTDTSFTSMRRKRIPFLRRRWREPLPAQTVQQLSELSSLCRDRHISLGIGLTPFEIYLNYDADTKMALRSKVLQLNEIRADMLCILFDDMRGDVDKLPALQVEVISDVCAWSNAKRFIVCPTRMIPEFARIICSLIRHRMRGNYPLPRLRASRSIQ
jgi:hyaluronoglucosaminidase